MTDSVRVKWKTGNRVFWALVPAQSMMKNSKDACKEIFYVYNLEKTWNLYEIKSNLILLRS